MITGLSSGRTTPKNSRTGPAPSSTAASSSSFGMVATKARNSRMQNDSPKVASMRIIPPMVLNRLRPCSTQIVGTIAGGTMSPARTKKLMTPFHRLGRRCST